MMKKILLLVCTLNAIITDWCIAQDIKTVKQALDAVSYIEPPYMNTKVTNYSYLGEFPINTVIPDKLYEDLQCTQYIHASRSEDLYPSLYLKMKVPATHYILGAVTFGGSTDYWNDQLFLADENGNITDVLEGAVLNYGIPIKQFRVLKNLDIIVSRLVVIDPAHLLYDDFIGKKRLIKAYRMDEIYEIQNGKFIKMKEFKRPENSYYEEQLYKLDIWRL